MFGSRKGKDTFRSPRRCMYCKMQKPRFTTSELSRSALHYYLQLARLHSTIDEALDWLDQNPGAEAEAFVDKQKEVEVLATPVIQRAGEDSTRGPSGFDEEDLADL